MNTDWNKIKYFSDKIPHISLQNLDKNFAEPTLNELFNLKRGLIRDLLTSLLSLW
jgi:hypothetical protein